MNGIFLTRTFANVDLKRNLNTTTNGSYEDEVLKRLALIDCFVFEPNGNYSLACFARKEARMQMPFLEVRDIRLVSDTTSKRQISQISVKHSQVLLVTLEHLKAVIEPHRLLLFDVGMIPLFLN
jgi:hypothetical protein